MYYGYKFRNCDDVMMMNTWGIQSLTRSPLVVFETQSDLYRYTGEDGEIEIVEFEKLWGFHSLNNGWHADRSRSHGVKLNLFSTSGEAEECCPEGYEVAEFLQYINMAKEESVSNSSPLKEFLLERLTPAVEALEWDFDKGRECTVSYPEINVIGSGVGVRSVTHSAPRSAGELVTRAIEGCEFKDADIFTYIPLELGQEAKFPTDFFCNQEVRAVITPREGCAPEFAICGEEVYVPTFKISNSITISRDYKTDNRWDVLQRSIEVIAQGFINKIVEEQNKTVAAAAPYKSTVHESSIMRALNEMMVQMKRGRGGNAHITDVYVTPEAYADIIDHAERQKRFINDSDVFEDSMAVLRQVGTVPTLKNHGLTVYGMRVHNDQVRVDEMTDMYYRMNDEKLGEWVPEKETVGQKLARWITFGPRHMLMQYERKPLMFGLDLTDRACFVTPFRKNKCAFFDDKTLTRSQRQGIYGWMEIGSAALDMKHVVAGTAEDGQLCTMHHAAVTPKIGKMVEFVLPLKRSGGFKGWICRWW